MKRAFYLWAAGGLMFGALVGCGGGGGGDAPAAPGSGSEPTACVAALPPTGAMVPLAGQVTYEFVPVLSGGLGGLAFSSSQPRPVRRALVEAVDANTGTVLNSSQSGETGLFSLDVPDNTCVQLRVKASASAAPSWSVDVVDNTRGGALYAMAGEDFDSGPSGQADKNLHAPTGWTGGGYLAQSRVAAPFAILDTAQKAIGLLVSADPVIVLNPLRLNWSAGNVSATGLKTDGAIGATHFDSGNNQIYILGDAQLDADEFDPHVIAHEVGHFFEWTLSRTDSMGGSHSLDERLDPRLAWSEGFGNAFSAMVMGDPVYADSFGPAPSGHVFAFDMESNPVPDNAGFNVGWFNESSVHSLVYDFFDGIDPSEGDGVSLGFGPIYQVMTGGLKTTAAATSIHSFSQLLKDTQTSAQSGIATLLVGQNIHGTGIYGDGETNSGQVLPSESSALPVYTELIAGAPPVNVCSSAERGTFNKLNNRRLFRFTLNAQRSVVLTAQNPVFGANSDPDIILYSQGNRIAFVEGETANVEVLPVPGSAGDPLVLPGGTYIGELYEFGNLAAPAVGQVCFDLQLQ